MGFAFVQNDRIEVAAAAGPGQSAGEGAVDFKAMYRVCKAFTVESGHMLSKHPERCRFPHGHTRRIEVVVVAENLDARDMVIDFKAIRLAAGAYIERLDHAMALNAADPLRPEMERVHPGSTVVFDQDPTTEVLARDLFDHIADVLVQGFDHPLYPIAPGAVRLERLRVWETPTSWAEYSR